MNYKRSDGGILLPLTELSVGGRFHIEHRRNGEILSESEDPNLVVNEGLNHILDAVLAGATQVSTWYVGLFEGNYTPTAGLTAATVTATATESTAYDEATRVAYVEAAASGQSITNSANRATFTINATKTIYGVFLVSAAAKSATTGTLLAASRFAAAKSVVAADELLVTYTFSATST